MEIIFLLILVINNLIRWIPDTRDGKETGVSHVTNILLSVFQEPGKRSQLWRMTGTGMLCHEGSSPPQSKPAQPRPLDTSLVLDIAGLAAVSDNRYKLRIVHTCHWVMKNREIFFPPNFSFLAWHFIFLNFYIFTLTNTKAQ